MFACKWPGSQTCLFASAVIVVALMDETIAAARLPLKTRLIRNPMSVADAASPRTIFSQ
jgi:hypothetical protein